MAIKLTGSTCSYDRDRLPLARALAGIAAAGFKFVSLDGEHAGGSLLDKTGDKAPLDELREAISSYGLQCQHASFGELKGDAKSTAKLLEFVGAGSYLGIQDVTVLAPERFELADDGRQVPKSEKTMAAEREAFVAGMVKALPEAESEGVGLTLAPRPGMALTGENLRELHGALGSANFAICHDPVQAHFYTGVDPAEDVGAVAGITRVLLATDHAGSSGRLRTVPPGDGAMNLQAVLAALVAEGFDGPVITARLGVLGAARIDREMKRAFAHLAAIRDRAMAGG